MASLGAYLDEVCDPLRVNPAEAEDIREELRAHLVELIEDYQRDGLSSKDAVQAALEEFGRTEEIRGRLDQVHQGDPWWVLRLKGLGVGMLFGWLLGMLLPLGGYLEPLVGRLSLPSGWDQGRIEVVLNTLVVGGLVGLVCAGGRRLHAAWLFGALVWTGEYLAHWVASLAVDAPSTDGGLGLLNSFLLAPVVGGFFALAVGAASAAILTLTRRTRPSFR